jgi:hypothetical protein
VKLALATEKDILFRLKSRKPSKRGFYVRSIINYLDSLQRAERATTNDNEATQYIAYFIEEAQDCFNSRSTTRLESEEFLTVFNEARNQKEAFYTASQRLNDFSKTIRTKQTCAIGKINEEDKVSAIRHIEKLNGIDFSAIPQRTWFFEGETFISPTWKQKGKPYQINRDIKAKFMANLKPQPQKKKKSIIERALNSLDILLNGVRVPQPTTTRNLATESTETEQEQSNPYDSNEKDSDGDIEDNGLIFNDLFGELHKSQVK